MTSLLLSQAKVNWQAKCGACSDRPRRTRFRDICRRSGVQHHLRHRDLAPYRFAAGFEIDRFRQALLRLARDLSSNRPRRSAALGMLVVGIDSPFGATLSPSHRPARTIGIDRQRGHHLHVGIGAAPGITMTALRGRQRSMLSASRATNKNRLES